MSQTILGDPVVRARVVGAASSVLHVTALDDQDRDLIEAHTRRYWALENPRPSVGDIVRLDWAGINSVRIAHLWPDGQFQPAATGAFRLQPVSLAFNGKLDLPKPTRNLVPLATPEWARVSIYHHGIARADQTLDVEIPRRVWVYEMEA